MAGGPTVCVLVCSPSLALARSVLNHLGCKAVFLQNFTEPNHGSDGKVRPPATATATYPCTTPPAVCLRPWRAG